MKDLDLYRERSSVYAYYLFKQYSCISTAGAFGGLYVVMVDKSLSTCPAKNQAGCIERVVHHSHENQKFYLFKIAINEKCQKPKLTVKVIMVAMATAV